MKKIMFDDEFSLTQAVLDRIKKQTRRIMKGKLLYSDDIIDNVGIYGNEVHILANGGTSCITLKLPYKVGEVVAVAQAYRDIANPDDGFLDDRYEVKDEYAAGWSNKMFVRSELMKHFIRIVNVRVERLQDISDEDCIAEGIYIDNNRTGYFNGCAFYFTKDQYGNVLAKKWYDTPREAYAALIDRISGKGTWKSNPYVFVYDFELID